MAAAQAKQESPAKASGSRSPGGARGGVERRTTQLAQPSQGSAQAGQTSAQSHREWLLNGAVLSASFPNAVTFSRCR